MNTKVMKIKGRRGDKGTRKVSGKEKRMKSTGDDREVQRMKKRLAGT